jgi:hypothetical protein
MKSALCFYLILLCALCSFPAFSQENTAVLSETSRWASTVAEQYWIQPDITYGVANNYTLKLDVWQRKDAKTAAPTLIYYHGGGWIFGDRTGATLLFLPYLEMGWNVINVEYRMASVSLAPAAVEDCRCALHWAVRNAKQYNIDVNRIVLTGHSAGGHLSLITGMLPDGTGLDNDCDGADKLKVAAIINWLASATWPIWYRAAIRETTRRCGWEVSPIHSQLQSESRHLTTSEPDCRRS